MAIDYREDYERAPEQYSRFDEGLLSSQYIDSPRTVRLLDEVCERIPEEDREILRCAIVGIIDRPRCISDAERALGSASDEIGVGIMDGVESLPPWQCTVLLNSDLLSECEDDAALAAIAHELAHVVLRHNSMNYPFARLWEPGTEVSGLLAEVRRVHEWEADLQAWMWGFSDELRQLWEYAERDLPPGYHQISLEPPD